MSERNYINKVEKDPEEQKILQLLLRSYAAAVKGSINVPKLTYIDEIAGTLDWERAQARRFADEYVRKFFKVPNFNLNKSMSLYLGMFNATMDIDDLVNLNLIKQTVQEKGFVEKTIDGIKIKPVKFTTGYGKFKKTSEYTQEYGTKNFNNSSKSTYIQFLLKMQKGDKIQGASFNIYHTGRIRFSGGYLEGSKDEAKALVRFISENYFPIDLRKPIQFNNNTIEIKLASNIKILGLYTFLNVARESGKFKGYTLSATFEPEKDKFITKQRKNSPFLYITFKKDKEKFGLVLSRNGTVVVEGVKDIRQTNLLVKEFFDTLKSLNMLDVPTQGRNLTIQHKKSKLARRVNMKPAPEVTRRGTTCPKERRPSPYSFQGKCPQGNNFYVRPNPQGQPCCYKKPKSIQYMLNRINNRYNKANVKVPESVRKTFGIGNNTNGKANNVGKSSLNNLEITFNQKIGRNMVNPVGLKIGSRQCLRYSKVALVDIARRKSIMLPKKVTKPILCEILAKHAKNSSQKKLPSNLLKNIKTKKAKLRPVRKQTPRKKLPPNLLKNIKTRVRPVRKQTPRKKLPPNLLKNIKTKKAKLRPVRKQTPSPDNSNYNNLLNFAARLKTR